MPPGWPSMGAGGGGAPVPACSPLDEGGCDSLWGGVLAREFGACFGEGHSAFEAVVLAADEVCVGSFVG